MNVLIILIPIALILGIGFTISFIWAVYSGQYDDFDTPANRMLFDDINKKENYVEPQK